jgi:hypothetical protein
MADINTLDNIINQKIDELIDDESNPVCRSMANTVHGKIKLFNIMKDMVLKEGMTDLDAVVAQIEMAADE